MIKKISTDFGVFEYQEKDFTGPNKKISIDIATKNLLEVHRVLGNCEVGFGLIYGTLLGAYRDNNFIEHDYDTDLYVLEENKIKLLNTLPELLKSGFKICRYDKFLLSIIRDGEYIDFYFFRKSSFYYRSNNVGLKYKAKFIENTVPYKFLGVDFQISKEIEPFLVSLYGGNWKTPIVDDPSHNHSSYIIFREYMKKNSSFLFIIMRKIKKMIS